MASRKPAPAKTVASPAAVAPIKSKAVAASKPKAVKPIAKPIAKPISKPLAKAPAAPVAVPQAEAAKSKAKLVRDSFTIPKSEYAVLGDLKLRAVQLKRHVKKSELLRAGVALLNTLPDKAFLVALDAVPSLKTGRPVKDEPPVAAKPAKPAKTTKPAVKKA